MANNRITFENPKSGAIKEAPVGFSWTSLFFWFFVPLVRGDWKWAITMFLLAVVTGGIAPLFFGFFIPSVPVPVWGEEVSLKWAIFILLPLLPTVIICGIAPTYFWFAYNKLYIKELISQGFKAKSVQKGTLGEISSHINLDIPSIGSPSVN